ncbi:small ribosomal subunit protein uS17 isoform X1 [Lepidochelys kempii]|uniref:small ribosomal subunit protein uS17 isoform X1 n=1 Tax=Lepidochelys kempii TaxID=8472 RepID=UPI003C70415B
MADTQTERAYQKQPTIFQNKKRVLLGEGGKEKLPRYYRNIGLGFKTPKEAIEGTYIDKKCPFTGNVSIRGRILSGVVTKMKMQRTIVIRRDYLHYIRKYNRFEKRHKNMSVHLSPCFRSLAAARIHNYKEFATGPSEGGLLLHQVKLNVVWAAWLTALSWVGELRDSEGE